MKIVLEFSGGIAPFSHRMSSNYMTLARNFRPVLEELAEAAEENGGQIMVAVSVIVEIPPGYKPRPKPAHPLVDLQRVERPPVAPEFIEDEEEPDPYADAPEMPMPSTDGPVPMWDGNAVKDKPKPRD